MYFVKFSKRIALSWDASRGLGDPFCFGFPQRKTQHRRGEQEGEENKTENEEIKRASNATATKKQRLKTHKKGDKKGLVRLVRCSRKQAD